jgi:hypothetical protein
MVSSLPHLGATTTIVHGVTAVGSSTSASAGWCSAVQHGPAETGIGATMVAARVGMTADATSGTIIITNDKPRSSAHEKETAAILTFGLCRKVAWKRPAGQFRRLPLIAQNMTIAGWWLDSGREKEVPRSYPVVQVFRMTR